MVLLDTDHLLLHGDIKSKNVVNIKLKNPNTAVLVIKLKQQLVG
jgi:hypothetical protein